MSQFTRQVCKFFSSWKIICYASRKLRCIQIKKFMAKNFYAVECYAAHEKITRWKIFTIINNFWFRFARWGSNILASEKLIARNWCVTAQIGTKIYYFADNKKKFLYPKFLGCMVSRITQSKNLRVKKILA